MNSETKRHIDAARQVLVGVVPNPTSQIEQITNALIYKFMDDMDQASIKAGGEPSFFIGELEPYAWTRIMDSRIGNQERMNLYSEALVKFSQAKQLPELFRGIFKSAFLPYRSPETLGLFLKEIDYFDYSHPEELGNAYEYLLSIMSSQGDAGQFRTPRHIIDFMVDVINPTKDDKVLDPACGTGGFLVSTYKHILEQHDGKNDPGKKEKPLTPDDRRKLMINFEGYDIDPTMVRIAQVNMYLHQFKNPKIYQYDSLSQEERWNDKFDVILANPPFMSPKGGIKPHSKFSVPSNRSEVLFVDYIINHLRPKGRAGIIVPEGIIFQSSNAYKQLRKSLIEDGLYAVVSLPSGVFAPYAGVKTSILLFNNELAKLSKEILFVKVENDGYDLGATKRPINKNDLPQALQELRAYEALVETGKATTTFTERIKRENAPDTLAIHHDKFILAKKSHVAESGDYNLSGDRYKPSKLLENTVWPMVELGDLCEISTGKKDVNQGNPNGKYPFFTCAREHTYIDTYSFDTEALLIAGNGDVGAVKHYKGKFDAYQRTYVLKNFKDVNVRYLFQVLNGSLKEKMQLQKLGNTMPYIKLGMLQDFKVPLPPLEVQEQIVKELDGYAAIINGAKQIATNWKPKIDIDPEWEKVKLGEVCEIGDGNHSSNYPKSAEMVQVGVPFIRGTNLVDGKIDPKDMKFISKEKHAQLKKGHLKTNDVLFTNRGEIGKVAIVDQSFDGANLNSQIAWLRSKQNLLPIYLISILMSDYTQNQLSSLKQGATLQQFTIKQLSAFEIPLPPLEIQMEIVEKIESERELVDASKKLIKIYEDKTKSALEKLYGHDD